MSAVMLEILRNLLVLQRCTRSLTNIQTPFCSISPYLLLQEPNGKRDTDLIKEVKGILVLKLYNIVVLHALMHSCQPLH